MTETSIIEDWLKTVPRTDTVRSIMQNFDASLRTVTYTDSLSIINEWKSTSVESDTVIYVRSGTQRLDVLALLVKWAARRASHPFKFSIQTSAIPSWLPQKDWRDDLVAEIDAYASKAPGWDGYAAIPINPAAISDASTFVRSLPHDIPQPMDQPCSDGEVSLVWRIERRFAQVAFPGDHTFSWYATNGGLEASGEDVPINAGLPSDLERVMVFETMRRSRVTTSLPPINYRIIELVA